MNLIQAPYIPASLTTVERSFVFDYYTLKSALFSSPNTNMYGHEFTESDSSYKRSEERRVGKEC